MGHSLWQKERPLMSSSIYPFQFKPYLLTNTIALNPFLQKVGQNGGAVYSLIQQLHRPLISPSTTAFIDSRTLPHSPTGQCPFVAE